MKIRYKLSLNIYDLDGVLCKSPLTISTIMKIEEIKKIVKDLSVNEVDAYVINLRRRLGSDQVILTGRGKMLKKQTKAMLKRAGLNWLKIYYYPKHLKYNKDDYYSWKYRMILKIGKKYSHVRYYEDDASLVSYLKDLLPDKYEVKLANNSVVVDD